MEFLDLVLAPVSSSRTALKTPGAPVIGRNTRTELPPSKIVRFLVDPFRCPHGVGLMIGPLKICNAVKRLDGHISRVYFFLGVRHWLKDV